MDNIDLLKKYSIIYLSKYNSSKRNLEKILKNKIIRMNIEKKLKDNLYNSISSIIKNLESQKLINDENYAYAKIHNFYSQGKSKYFIVNYLKNKGIEKNLINKEINNFNLENPNWEDESAKTFIIKKKLDLKDNKNKEKNLAKMARAGFSYEIIKKTLEID